MTGLPMDFSTLLPATGEAVATTVAVDVVSSMVTVCPCLSEEKDAWPLVAGSGSGGALPRTGPGTPLTTAAAATAAATACCCCCCSISPDCSVLSNSIGSLSAFVGTIAEFT